MSRIPKSVYLFSSASVADEISVRLFSPHLTKNWRLFLILLNFFLLVVEYYLHGPTSSENLNSNKFAYDTGNKCPWRLCLCIIWIAVVLLMFCFIHFFEKCDFAECEIFLERHRKQIPILTCLFGFSDLAYFCAIFIAHSALQLPWILESTCSHFTVFHSLNCNSVICCWQPSLTSDRMDCSLFCFLLNTYFTCISQWILVRLAYITIVLQRLLRPFMVTTFSAPIPNDNSSIWFLWMFHGKCNLCNM